MSRSLYEQTKPSSDNEEDQDCLFAIQLSFGTVLPMALRAAIELDLLEIIAKAGKDAQLTSSEIASHLATENPDAPFVIDRMLRLLASYSILTCTLVTGQDGQPQRLYGLAPVCKYFTKDEDGVSFGPFLMASSSKHAMDTWFHLKGAILEGSNPVYRAHGKQIFEFQDEFNDMFNQAMRGNTMILMKRVLQAYKGFEGIKVLVDVGGGIGANLGLVVSKFPQIKGINYDLPHVIKQAPSYSGVVHVEGDMFHSVPKGEVIFMKSVLHDWDDDRCLKLLKNCYDALPEFGRVIAVESVVSEFPGTDLLSKNIFNSDMGMFLANEGKERTEKELEVLAKGAGFAAMKLVCRAYTSWVIEFYKEKN